METRGRWESGVGATRGSGELGMGANKGMIGNWRGGGAMGTRGRWERGDGWNLDVNGN